MSVYFLIPCMIFFHILDDYKLQAGVLAMLKQRSYWEKEAPDRLYRYDYLMALVMHSLSWSFMIMLPTVIYSGFSVGVLYVLAFIVNAIIHFIVDDLKANRHKINLIVDQCIHLAQILVTALLFIV